MLCSGTIGDHGMAVMLARGDLAMEADITSDTAPLNGLVECLLERAPSTRWLRDATRGGVGTVCNELARDANLTVVLEEPALPGAAHCGRRLRTPGNRSALRGQRRQAHRRGGTGRVRGGPGGHARHPHGAEATRIGRIHSTLRASSCFGPPLGAPGSSTCWSGTPFHASAEERQQTCFFSCRTG